MIEFQIDDDIKDEEALRLIETPVIERKEDKWKEEITENRQTLQLEHHEDDEKDPFVYRATKGENNSYQPVVVGRKTLLSFDSSSILICKWPAPLKCRYFRNILPDLHIVMCESCFKCYHVDDYELQLLQNGSCPFCRSLPDNLGLDSNEEFVV